MVVTYPCGINASGDGPLPHICPVHGDSCIAEVKASPRAEVPTPATGLGECFGCGCSKWACDAYRTAGKVCCPDCKHSTSAEARLSALLQALPMSFADFSAENRRRCEHPKGFNHRLDSWSLSDWFTAVVGELGEAANVAKKLNRVRDGIPGNDETPDELRAKLSAELADAFIYLDLLAQSQGIDLSAAVRETFDRKSEKIGYAAALRAAAEGEMR